jgi:hypothetical protein
LERAVAAEAQDLMSLRIAHMSGKSIVIQIQGTNRPLVGRSANDLVSCIAMLLPSDAWEIEADINEDWCNIQVRTRSPALQWKKLLALLSNDPASLHVLEDHWIVVCEGRRSWDDYKTLAHFKRKKSSRASH